MRRKLGFSFIPFFKCFLLLHPSVEVVREKGFHLDVEDYLAGVLIMASELVSLLLIDMLRQQHIKAGTMIVCVRLCSLSVSDSLADK